MKRWWICLYFQLRLCRTTRRAMKRIKNISFIFYGFYELKRTCFDEKFASSHHVDGECVENWLEELWRIYRESWLRTTQFYEIYACMLDDKFHRSPRYAKHESLRRNVDCIKMTRLLLALFLCSCREKFRPRGAEKSSFQGCCINILAIKIQSFQWPFIFVLRVFEYSWKLYSTACIIAKCYHNNLKCYCGPLQLARIKNTFGIVLWPW